MSQPIKKEKNSTNKLFLRKFLLRLKNLFLILPRRHIFFLLLLGIIGNWIIFIFLVARTHKYTLSIVVLCILTGVINFLIWPSLRKDRKTLPPSGLKVLTAFPEDADKERVDKYIDAIRESLKGTTAKFQRLHWLMVLSLLAYHLFIYGGQNIMVFFSVSIKDVELVKKWFLIIPSSLFCLSCCFGYLRVYQQEVLGWLLAKFHPDEFKSDIFRLTFPASYILGLDLMRREDSIITKVVANTSSFVFVVGTYFLPTIYVYWAYLKSYEQLGFGYDLSISSAISILLFMSGYLIIFRSQEI